MVEQCGWILEVPDDIWEKPPLSILNVCETVYWKFGNVCQVLLKMNLGQNPRYLPKFGGSPLRVFLKITILIYFCNLCSQSPLIELQKLKLPENKSTRVGDQNAKCRFSWNLFYRSYRFHFCPLCNILDHKPSNDLFLYKGNFFTFSRMWENGMSFKRFLWKINLIFT